MRPLIRRILTAHFLSLHLRAAWMIVLPGLLMSACGGMSTLTPIGEGPLGTVALERLTSRGATAKYSSPFTSFQATHPAALPAPMISRVLAGLSVSGVDRPGRTAGQEIYSLLSHEEAEFLAPLIVSAFAQAQPDQRVRFEVQDDGLRTQGSLYLHQKTLRLSLSHYRSTPAQGDARPPALRLTFNPTQALVQQDTPQSWMNIEPAQPRVAIAIDILGQLSAASPAPADKHIAATVEPPQAIPATGRSPLQQELQATKDLVVKQANELQRLKEELESVRRQLAEKENAPSKAKSKTIPRKPSPQR